MNKTTDIEKAKECLQENTIALCKGCFSFVSAKKGIAPMMEFIELGIDFEGFSVADKVVGKAVALLFVKSKIANLYTKTLSKSAKQVLDKYNIPYTYDTLCDYIKNRKGDGRCPMESAVENTFDPEKAYEILKEKLAQMKN